MECPKCGGETSVKDSRPMGATISRRRRCDRCGHGFRTYEVLVEEPGLLALAACTATASESLRALAAKLAQTADDVDAVARLKGLPK